jgi:hypothetical protein
LAVVVAAVSVALRSAPPSRITRENCARIHEGMTQADVEVILGPPGDYRARTTEPTSMSLVEWQAGSMSALWTGNEDWSLVTLDHDGIVTADGFFAPSSPEGVTALDNLLWRLEHQWYWWFA